LFHYLKNNAYYLESTGFYFIFHVFVSIFCITSGTSFSTIMVSVLIIPGFHYCFYQQSNSDVTIINGASGVTLTLNSVQSFASSDVSLIGGTDTLYVCSFTSSYTSVINVTTSKTFAVEGGTLQLGGGISYSFCWVTGGGSLSLLYLEIQFMSKMNSMIHVTGGTVTLEHVHMRDQLDTRWTAPLVSASATSSSITVHIISCTITNCQYKYGSSGTYRASPVVSFSEASSSSYFIALNMTSSSFHNSTFYLLEGDCAGGTCMFFSLNTASGIFNSAYFFPSFYFSYILFLLFLFFQCFLLLVASFPTALNINVTEVLFFSSFKLFFCDVCFLLLWCLPPSILRDILCGRWFITLDHHEQHLHTHNPIV
jgi:hypothetical protein